MLAEVKRVCAGGMGGSAPRLPLIIGHKSAVSDQPRAEPGSETLCAKRSKPSAKRCRELSLSKASARARAIRLNNRWAKFSMLQASLVASLEKIGRGKLAHEVTQCHTSFGGCRCKACGGSWARATFSCGVRLCPWEARKRSMRAIHRFGDVIAGLRDPRYLVLSMRNCPLHELRAGIRALFDTFQRLRHSVLWSASVKGALVALEVTFNAESQTWHPHLNVLIEGSYIPQEQLAAAWRKAARDEGLILPYIKRADSGTAFELLKYVTKLADFVHIPEAVGAFVDATRRTRFLRTYGCLYGLKLAEEDGDGAEALECPDCGSPDVEVLRHCFSRNDVYFDGSGVLRLCLPLHDSERFRRLARCGVPSYDG